MALSMHTNYTQLVTQNQLNKTNSLMSTAMERLSTGYRINSASDDAAGLQIANRLEAQTRGMSVAMRNAQDGISMMQTAEGAMDEMTNIVYRMADLATQAQNDSNGTAELKAMDAEFQQLAAELENINDNTSFGGNKLLGAAGKFGAATVTFQIGASNSEKLNVDVKTGVAAVETKIDGLADILTSGTASTALGALTSTGGLLETIGAARASFGANVNRLEHTITNLGNMSENTAAAKGRIMDADFAVESSNMTKNQMLMQAGTSMLNQTKQMSGMAMSLLG